MKTPWNWTPERTLGIWRHGAPWLRPVAAAAPYVTVVLLLLMLHIAGGGMAAAKGVLFDLPDAGLDDGAATSLVAIMLPHDHETLVFFDDSRYVLDDDASLRTLGEDLSARTDRDRSKTLLVLADRRVSGGDLMKFAAVARRNGVMRILFAGKSEETAE